MIDSHNHLQDIRIASKLDAVVEDLREEGIGKWLVNGTSERDWESVAKLADRFEEVVPFFGLHPWRVEERSDGWIKVLDDYLDRYPNAGIGEVGLDKWIRNADLDDQDSVLRPQVELAIQRNRPLAVHCLQAWGTLQERIDEYGIGPRCLLHSFGGPLEMVPDFVESGAYFSISGYFFRPDKRKKLETYSEIPLSRLLIETDAPDMAMPADMRKYRLSSRVSKEEGNHPANLTAVYGAVSEHWEISEGNLGPLIRDNYHRWFDGSFEV